MRGLGISKSIVKDVILSKSYEEIELRVNKCAYFVPSRQSGAGTGSRKAAD